MRLEQNTENADRCPEPGTRSRRWTLLFFGQLAGVGTPDLSAEMSQPRFRAWSAVLRRCADNGDGGRLRRMLSIDDWVSSIVAELGLDEQDIAARKAFLELNAADVRQLRVQHERLGAARGRFIEVFYAHLLRFAATRELIATPELQARLRHKQSDYFEQLTAGEYGWDYVADRLRVGLVHQQIGLDPKWYLGAYCKYLTELLPEVWEDPDQSPESRRDAIRALLKVVFFDMGLALETYFHADRRSILALKEYAENVVCSVPSGLLALSADLEVITANRCVDRLYDAPHDALIGRRLEELFADDELSRLARDVIATGRTHRHLALCRPEKGGEYWLEATLAPLATGMQQHLHPALGSLCRAAVLLVLEDVTEQEQLRTARRAAEDELAKLAGALAQTADSVIITDRDGRIEYANPAFEQTTGYPCAEVVGLTPRILKSGRHSANFYQRLWRTIARGAVFREIFINRRKDGELYYEEKTISPVRDPHSGEINHFVSTGKDISERMQIQQRLDHLAHHDMLTDLPNRRLLLDRLQRAMTRATRRHRRMAVLFLDLDRFKQINDTLGHGAGDRLLCAVASRLTGCLRREDTVARLGGDEFAVLLEDLEHAEDVAPILEKLVSAMQRPFALDGHEFFLTFSIGISIYPDDGELADVLLRNADTAMYRAKEGGRNGYRFYTADMNARAFERLELESKLRRALEREEFVLHYQPKLDLRSGCVVGIEALLRWQHPERGLLPPAEFIPTLEDTGMIVPVGRWVLHEACRQARIWRLAGLPPLEVAVNISTHQFRQDDMYALVKEALAIYCMPPGELELEITESALMNHIGPAAESIRRLKERGVKVSIDDFGTGYSSLAYLKRFAIDSLKIDRTFVRDICDDKDDAAIVAAIVAMAQRLHLKVVAEGVETKGQLAFLREQGCDQMQGYLLARPMPGNQLASWLAERVEI